MCLQVKSHWHALQIEVHPDAKSMLKAMNVVEQL
jgi:hypothetical protein